MSITGEIGIGATFDVTYFFINIELGRKSTLGVPRWLLDFVIDEMNDRLVLILFSFQLVFKALMMLSFSRK